MDWIGLDLTFPITDPTWIFLLVLLIILFAPILLNKLRIPHIIGMILAGLAIGEHGFNILARDSSFQLFGESRTLLHHVPSWSGNEYGRFQRDAKTKHWYWDYWLLSSYRDWIRGKCILSEIWCNHLCIISQHVCLPYARGYPIVTRFGISRHRSVSIAVGGTAVTDTLTLLVLAVIGGLFKGETGGLFWIGWW